MHNEWSIGVMKKQATPDILYKSVPISMFVDNNYNCPDVRECQVVNLIMALENAYAKEHAEHTAITAIRPLVRDKDRRTTEMRNELQELAKAAYGLKQ